MKFELDTASRGFLIRSYTRHHIVVGDWKIDRPVVISGTHIDADVLPARVTDLDATHIARLVRLNVDIIVLGTGERQIFLASALTAPLLERGIGLETMGTAAACRCYNILRSEDRSVAAALFMIAEGDI